METLLCRHYRTGEALALETRGETTHLRAPAAAERAEAERTELLLAPAFFDLQINGYRRVIFASGDFTTDEVAGVVEEMARHGVAFFCAAVSTQAEERICRALRTIVAACAASPAVDRAIVGIHLEGPYISGEDGPRGAHPAPWVRDPDWEEFQRFQEAAGGRIRLHTLAPERAGSVEFIRRVAASGVRVALGHTGADTEEIAAAVDAGATLCTHLGNGAHALLPRHPNYIWDQLADDRLHACLITDGFHLPPAVVRGMVRVKGCARTIITSDVSAMAGLPPGEYTMHDGRRIDIAANGRISLVGTLFLSGTAVTTEQCVTRAAQYAGIDLADAIDMAAVNPWRALGLESASLAAGSPCAGAMVVRPRPDTLEIVKVIR